MEIAHVGVVLTKTKRGRQQIMDTGGRRKKTDVNHQIGEGIFQPNYRLINL